MRPELGQVEPVARVTTFTGAAQRALGDQIGEVAGGGRGGRAGDAAVVRGAEAAGEFPIDVFATGVSW